RGALPPRPSDAGDRPGLRLREPRAARDELAISSDRDLVLVDEDARDRHRRLRSLDAERFGVVVRIAAALPRADHEGRARSRRQLETRTATFSVARLEADAGTRPTGSVRADPGCTVRPESSPHFYRMPKASAN